MKKTFFSLSVLFALAANFACMEAGAADLQSARQSDLPEGMVLIPGGTNAGTDPDFGAYSLTVEPFYMDASSVTKTRWDEVYSWAVRNGYQFDNPGSAKASDHPVHTVTWYDAVKWCNARSEMEGRMPVYTVNGEVYRSGQHTPDLDRSKNGYRLPTMTEWEYAARGGLRGKRFPWGDPITHEQANYFALRSISYDENPARGYPKKYNDGTALYTAPAGAFPPNGYGLYDMAGNVWDWCWDASGSRRGIRGGGWSYTARHSRTGAVSWQFPGSAYNNNGFRTVRR